MTGETTPSVRMMAAELERRFPVCWAEPWDRVGHVIGDADAPVAAVFVTLDATGDAIERAAAAGANLVVTHHPPYLEVPERIVRGAGPAGTIEAALRLGVGVISMHTNLDRSPAGAEALPGLLGLPVIGPLESSLEPVALVVTYAPAESVAGIRDAMALAGAGRLGEYERAAFTGTGVGWFDPLSGATPAVAGGGEGVPEVRLEMIAPRAQASAVAEAARQAHPYEEPVVLVTEAERVRGAARLGRVCDCDGLATVGALARRVAERLGVSVRVWGDENAALRTVAVANGSAGSLIPDALGRTEALVAGEVRYHDALSAVASGLHVIEAGHDATEWPLVTVLAEALRAVTDPDHTRVLADEPRIAWSTVEVLHD